MNQTAIEELLGRVRSAEALLIEHLEDPAARGPTPKNRIARAQKLLTTALGMAKEAAPPADTA